MVKNLPSNAGDAGSIPGWGTKIPHAAGQLSPCATTREKPAWDVEPTHHNKDPTQPKINECKKKTKKICSLISKLGLKNK